MRRFSSGVIEIWKVSLQDSSKNPKASKGRNETSLSSVERLRSFLAHCLLYVRLGVFSVLSTNRFVPAGRCIYCGATNVTLSDEHIIPYSLGGQLVLPQASCCKCANITSKFESSVARHAVIKLRVSHNLPTRRRNARPKTFEVIVDPEAVNVRKSIETKSLPQFSWALPLFGPSGWENQREMGDLPRVVCVVNEMDGDLLLSHGGSNPVKYSLGSINFEAFGRTIAKIAHSFAYALLGPDGFKPCLGPLILNGSSRYSFWIGSGTERSRSNDLYDIWLTEITNIFGQKLLGVGVQLFCHLGTPIYGALVGEAIGDRFKNLKSQRYAVPLAFNWIDAAGSQEPGTIPKREFVHVFPPTVGPETHVEVTIK